VQEELGALRSAGAKVWLDRDFTESRLRESLAERPIVVHLASHFSLDPAGEEKSFLLLGDGQSLSLSAIGAMPWHGVKLALLSACESGVSLEAGPGQALVGFASTLQRAGVENVLATLWRVSDGATAQWVEMFYAGSLQGQPNIRRKLTAGQVAATQRQWLQRFAGSSLVHPHYWASFMWLDHE
jgi:CHAT domain-containing protein